MREELEAAVRAHQEAPVAAGADRESIIDAGMPTAATIGWATLVLAGVPLTAPEQAEVAELAATSFSMIGLMPVQARPYFARLGFIAALTAALAVDTRAQP